MAGSRSLAVRWVLVGALALGLAVLAGVLLRPWSHAGGSGSGAGSAKQPATAATGPRRLSSADLAAAPVVVLHRLPTKAVKGRIALPWREVGATRNAVSIVFASRPSCEQLEGVVVEQSASSVTINVLASNIVNAPNCDLVPKLKRTVVKLAVPLAARPVRHAALDRSYWPTNPFMQA